MKFEETSKRYFLWWPQWSTLWSMWKSTIRNLKEKSNWFWFLSGENVNFMCVSLIKWSRYSSTGAWLNICVGSQLSSLKTSRHELTTKWRPLLVSRLVWSSTGLEFNFFQIGRSLPFELLINHPLENQNSKTIRQCWDGDSLPALWYCHCRTLPLHCLAE